MDALTVRDVTKAFPSSGAATTLVVDGCSFTLEADKLTVMVGPSGCGKTTLINLIAGYERPTSGDIAFEGRPVTGPGADRLVVFQESALFPWMTVQDNVMFGPLARGESHTAVQERTNPLLRRVGLLQFAKRYPNQLSGGMQRRAELARAIINEPRLMLMDEPFRGLDAMTRELMQEHYLRLFEERPRTSLFVASELTEAIFLADAILVMAPKPTRVKRVIPVDLPRPRTLDMQTSERFRELFAETMTSLYDDTASPLARVT
jgi:NitT/TauT family transport system ATP-binding protein